MIRMLFACVGLMAATTTAHAEGHDHDFGAHGLHIVHPWLRATERGDAYLFLEIHNEGDAPRVLNGATATWGGQGEVVGFSLQDGQGRYVPLPNLPIAAGNDIALRPNEIAIRIPAIRGPLTEGGHVDLDLLTDAGPITIEAVIEAADARDHSHAGHAH